FTLVEVIVVIVIIAILAAIGVPALTGYIDKAQDKKYIMQARDAMIAMRAVIDEAYANGELAKNSSTNTSLDDYANSGVPSQYYNPEYNGNLLKYWDINNLSRFATNDPAKLKNSAIALSGSDYGQFYIIGPHDSSATDADGFFCRILPEGSAPGDPVIFVTYNMGWLYGGLESMDDYDFYADDEYYVWAELKDWGTYDPNAGYQIIHSSFVL
ncbi:MAG: prepilin-type N-terminal cleavage/methylation domain-containing protein, partial [Clostridiales Family XIII bacterium]|nr:prepilin-type N-terminal cleavage/methylation domain-containing protein [Clostridiales Family XIII bacterium]